MKKNIILGIIILLSLRIDAYTQIIKRNLGVVPEKTIANYAEFAGEHAVVFSGKEQFAYEYYATNHPYLETSAYRLGELYYNNVWYKDIPLRYDLFRDELIVNVPNIYSNIVLEKEKVTEAMLNTTRIIQHKEGLWPGVPKGNYLILLYDGLYPVVKKNLVTCDQKIEGQSVEYTYRTRERFYIYKEGVCHPVSGKGSVLKLFPDKKRELETYIKKNKLNFRKNREWAIVSIVALYEELTK